MPARTVVLAAVALAATTPRLAAQSYLVVIGGLGGEPAYDARFHDLGLRLVTAAHDRWGLDAESVYWLAPAADADAHITARSTKAEIERLLDSLASHVAPRAQLSIVLIGHGSATGGEPKLNLPGPDMTAADFAALLARFPTQEITFVDLTSASGDFVRALSRGGRTIVTATRSGFERNQPEFAERFVDALTEGGADTDKDGRVSVLEAFEYARREVERAYDQRGQLLSEHALLDDNGDGEGSTVPDPAGGDGARAARTFFAAEAAADRAPATADSALAALYRRRADLEDSVANLRARRATMDSTAYGRQLESLLLDLARTNRAIREREGTPP